MSSGGYLDGFFTGALLGVSSTAVLAAVLSDRPVEGLLTPDDKLQAEHGKVTPDMLCRTAEVNAMNLNDYFAEQSNGKAPKITATVTPDDKGCTVRLATSEGVPPNAPAPQ